MKCRHCQKTEDEHHAFEPAHEAPGGCVCDPDEWCVSPIPSACEEFVPMGCEPDLCVWCEHLPGCHRRGR